MASGLSTLDPPPSLSSLQQTQESDDVAAGKQRLSLTQARMRRLWSAGRLAKESGVAPTTILAIERGAIRRPHLETIEKLATALELDADGIVWPGYPRGLAGDGDADPS